MVQNLTLTKAFFDVGSDSDGNEDSCDGFLKGALEGRIDTINVGFRYAGGSEPKLGGEDDIALVTVEGIIECCVVGTLVFISRTTSSTALQNSTTFPF